MPSFRIAFHEDLTDLTFLYTVSSAHFPSNLRLVGRGLMKMQYLKISTFSLLMCSRFGHVMAVANV